MIQLNTRPTQCLVTGAAGFIGSRLCERWDTAGLQRYRPLVRRREDASAYIAKGRRPVLADLLNQRQIDHALERVDAVVHLAFGHRAIEATRQLIGAAAARGVKRFVHISTMSVHGPAPGPEAATEATATISRYGHEYSDIKAEIEQIVQAAHDRGDLQVVILRPTVVYGPRGHFVMQIIDEARTGKVTRFDGGNGICNAVYVDDVCDAIDAALVRPQAIGEAMFVNGDAPVTWGDFITAFATMVDPEPTWVDLSSEEALRWWSTHPAPRVNGFADRVRLKLKRLAGWRPPPAPWPPEGRVLRETFRVTFDNSKAKRLLGWSPQVDFQAGIALTRSWLMQEGLLSP